MTEIIAVAVITVLAVISPGADFAMVVRNSYLYGRTTGLLAAAGVAAGVLVHVTYTMLGVGLLIASSTVLFTAIKLAGAAYLVYIGVRTFFARNDLAVDLESKPGLKPARGPAHRLPHQRAEPQDHALRRVDVHPGRRTRHRPVAAGRLRALHVPRPSRLVRTGRAVLLARPPAHRDAAVAEGPQPGHRIGARRTGRHAGPRPLRSATDVSSCALPAPCGPPTPTPLRSRRA